jgi:hypothetical protein
MTGYKVVDGMVRDRWIAASTLSGLLAMTTQKQVHFSTVPLDCLVGTSLLARPKGVGEDAFRDPPKF